MNSLTLSRRQWLLAATSTLTPLAALAQTPYPSKPIEVLVGFPGGGALDVATRVLTDALAGAGLSPLVIMNRPGASATLAATLAARASADGHTVLLATSANMGIAPHLYPKLNYAPQQDFLAVAQFARGQNLIYASRASGITSFAQLRQRLRAEPGQLNYASPGAGTTAHLGMEMLKAREQLFVVHVPFRGSPAAISSVVAGEVEIGIDALGPTQAFLKAGRIVPLAQTGEQRSALLPDVPTLAELGQRDMPAGTYLGLSVPAQTPAAVVARLRQATQAALRQPEVVQKLALTGFEAAFQDGPAFAAMMERDRRQWAEAVRYSGASNL